MTWAYISFFCVNRCENRSLFGREIPLWFFPKISKSQFVWTRDSSLILSKKLQNVTIKKSRMALSKAPPLLSLVVLFYLTGLITGFNPEIQMPYKSISGSSTSEVSAIGSTLTCSEQRASVKECAEECYHRWVHGWQVKTPKKFNFIEKSGTVAWLE